jgi:hypothetical protein
LFADILLASAAAAIFVVLRANNCTSHRRRLPCLSAYRMTAMAPTLRQEHQQIGKGETNVMQQAGRNRGAGKPIIASALRAREIGRDPIPRKALWPAADVCRINRSNTWPHRPALQNRSIHSCQRGAVHTWRNPSVPDGLYPRPLWGANLPSGWECLLSLLGTAAIGKGSRCARRSGPVKDDPKRP